MLTTAQTNEATVWKLPTANSCCEYEVNNKNSSVHVRNIKYLHAISGSPITVSTVTDTKMENMA